MPVFQYLSKMSCPAKENEPDSERGRIFYAVSAVANDELCGTYFLYTLRTLSWPTEVKH